MSKRFLLMMALSLSSIGMASAQEQKPDDVVFRALKDEMQRSTTRLHLDKYKSPYFVSYTVDESQTFNAVASVGALNQNSMDRSRHLKIDIREGDYTFDSHGSSGGLDDDAGDDDKEAIDLILDDNYDAIRHQVWFRTDAAYKAAVERFIAKKAALQTREIKDPADSMSREKPLQYFEEPVKLEVNRTAMSDMLRRLSAIFKKHPLIKKSMLVLNDQANTTWFVNSEGTTCRTTARQCLITAVASVQAPGGVTISDHDVFAAKTAALMPSEAEMAQRLEALADRLDKLSEAKAVDGYRGPVLFEGQAAAQFVSDVLQGNLAYSGEPQAPASGNARISFGLKNPFNDRLNTRILPAFINVIDDPTDEGSLASYKVDDDGVPAQKITLVDKGILKTFAIGRTPSREIKNSNGHGNNTDDYGICLNLKVASDKQLAKDKLKDSLLAYGKENDLKEVLIARRLSNFISVIIEPRPLFGSLISAMLGRGELRLSAPVELYAVDVETGKERLVRGAQFSNLSLQLLKDIEATGDDSQAYHVFSGSVLEKGSEDLQLATITTPTILVREIEITSPPKQNSVPIILKNPCF